MDVPIVIAESVKQDIIRRAIGVMRVPIHVQMDGVIQEIVVTVSRYVKHINIGWGGSSPDVFCPLLFARCSFSIYF